MTNAGVLSISTPFGFWCNSLILNNNSAAVWMKKASLQLPKLTTGDDKPGALGGFNLARPVWLTPIIFWRVPSARNDWFTALFHISSRPSSRAAFIVMLGQQSMVAPMDQWCLLNGLPGRFPHRCLPACWCSAICIPKLNLWGQVVMSARYFLLCKVEPKPAASCCLA